jgi:HSP20 family protein
MLPVLCNNFAFATRPTNRLDSIFEKFFGDDGRFMGPSWSCVPVAMWEDADHIFIEAELPGVAEEDVDVTVHNGMLFIRGERRPDEGRRYLYNGRSFGRFERVITLPEAVNADEVDGTLRDGVLRVDLPKRPEAKPKKIALKLG